MGGLNTCILAHGERCSLLLARRHDTKAPLIRVDRSNDLCENGANGRPDSQHGSPQTVKGEDSGGVEERGNLLPQIYN